MSGSAPGELNAATIIAQIESGAVPHEALLSFARGFLPLERDDLIGVLAYLTRSSEEDVAQLAKVSLAELPAGLVVGLAVDERANPLVLQNLAFATGDSLVLQALVRNRSFPDEAVVELAKSDQATIQEVVVINQERIIRSPEILDALLANPALTPDVRRRALETREEFFDKKTRLKPVELGVEEELADASTEPIADLLAAAESAPATPPAELVARVPEVAKADAKTQALFARILTMTIAEKVLLAFRGDRSARTLLVRERNKLVCSAAIRNPRMTDTEVEQIAGMRNVEDEVLRVIGLRRDWLSKYNIVLALCRNPKAPIGVVLPLINRLTLRDLKGLKDDKGVSETVRTTARRAYNARTQKS